MRAAKWMAAIIATVAICQAQVSVMLSPVASPSSGQAGVTSVNVTGTSFPGGTITPANTIVQLQPASGGPPVVIQPNTVTTIIGSTRRVTFVIPASISIEEPTPYLVSISGTTSSQIAFASSNSASLTITAGTYSASGAGPTPAISDFNPKSGPVGTQITLAGSNLSPSPVVTLAKQGGGTVTASVASSGGNSIAFIIPAGAATGAVAVTVKGKTATSSAVLTVPPPPNFTISMLPSPASLIRGQSVNLNVSLTGSNGFAQAAALSVSGVPSGVTSGLSPQQIGDGQIATLTLTAPANQPTSGSDITVTASATIDGSPVVHTATAHLNVVVDASLVSVSTAQYNNERTGANLTEKVLTPANVAGIKKLGSFAVDGNVYAHPLIITGVSISGAATVLVTVTMHNSVYVFDADAPGSPYIWTRNLGTPLTSHPGQADNFLYQQEMGCMATPVVDTSAGVIYALCVTSSGIWKLYSFNLANGTDFHAPVTISGTANGLTFDPIRQFSRVALGLVNGVLNLAFTGFADELPYQGWVFAYNASTLSQVGAWSVVDTLNGGAGIWSSGGGLASDGTSLFASTGNGTFAAKNYGNAIVRLSPLLAPLDYATPADWADINAHDRDISSGRVLVVGNYVIGGGKDGRIFVLDKSGSATMGGLEGSSGTPLHQILDAQNGAIFGCTVFANNSLIVGAMNTTMKRYSWNGSSFNPAAVAIGVDPYPNPGPACSYSSNGADTTTGIVWGVTPVAMAFSVPQPGILRAWSALTLAEIYSSDAVPGNALGNFAKFASPTVANGRVYVSTFSNAVSVYGFASTQ